MLVLALLSMLLMAQQKPKFEIREIKATGCVRRAAESQCLLLETLITIQGKSHQGRSACKQGIPIDITDWEPTGDRCVEPPKK